ncbi:MAG: hypothetical protein LBB47_00645, partial [Spirochaetaceae bacterium]|nr:hypothetical protein [Spirochaetaceae bacterium]
LLHRLDYETSGLVFAALTQRVMDAMLTQQGRGLFVKDYEAIVCETGRKLPGFPPCPAIPAHGDGWARSFSLESGFRCYGAGRKAVRPVLSGGGNAGKYAVYQTEILDMEPAENPLWRVSPRLARGFRHQVRCHLAWLGIPILGDILYGGKASGGPLALRAAALSFFDPLSGDFKCHRLDPDQKMKRGKFPAELTPGEPKE